MAGEGSAAYGVGTLCLQFLDAEPADLAGWARREVGVTDVGPATASEQRDARTLAAAVQRIAAMLAHGAPPAIGDIARVNRLANAPDLPPQVVEGGVQGWPEPVTVGQVLATVARDAVMLITSDRVDRVRMCAAEDCERIFLDTSRPGRRRWCSMATCGNRAKVRAFRARSQ